MKRKVLISILFAVGSLLIPLPASADIDGNDVPSNTPISQDLSGTCPTTPIAPLIGADEFRIGLNYGDTTIPHYLGRDIWFETHFCEPGTWAWLVNGTTPYWKHVIQSRIDIPTDVIGHYGPCQQGRSCIRIYDGYFGATGWLGQTFANSCLQHPGNICSVVAINLNDSYLTPGSSTGYGTDHYRGHVLCHEGSHASGLFYHRTVLTNPESCMYVGSPRSDALSPTDIGYVNGMY